MHIAVFLLLLTQQPQPAKSAADLRTTAERTGYKSTSTYDDVMALSKNLAAKYPSLIKVDSIGTSVEGRKLPMLVVSNHPSITTAAGTRVWQNGGAHVWKHPCGRGVWQRSTDDADPRTVCATAKTVRKHGSFGRADPQCGRQ